MSDEILNGTEETAALFVAKQKKKEEEKKAAEEQAERNLKEAEVQRMEAEIAEQKKKALRGRLIAVGVGAVAVIITLVVIILVKNTVSKIGKVDYAALEFDAEYTPKAEGNKIAIKYPGSFYAEPVESKKDDNGIYIDFSPEKETNATTKVSIDSMTTESETMDLEIGAIPFIEQKVFVNNLRSMVEKELGNAVPGAAISDESESDVTAANPGKYYYNCTFTSKEKSGGAGAFVKISDKGVAEIVTITCMNPGEDATDGITLRDAFMEANSEDAFIIAGGNPPSKDLPLDSFIDCSEINFKLIMPKDLFYKNKTSNKSLITFGDKNGAGIMVFPILYEKGFESLSVSTEQLMSYYQQVADTGLSSLVTNVSDRTALSEDYSSSNGEDFLRTYKVNWHGTDYYEIFYMTTWRDEVNGGDYFLQIELFSPYENKDVYDAIYMKSLQDFFNQ